VRAVNRRRWLEAAGLVALVHPRLGLAAGDGDDAPARPGQPLRFPRDHGAHLQDRIEWWYATGWLNRGSSVPPLGFQLTFFRQRTDLPRAASGAAGRFAPLQLLSAHAAVSDIGANRHRHAQRVARWSGNPQAAEARASATDTNVAIGPWQFSRDEQGVYRARIPAEEAGFELDLSLKPTQPLLLQGHDGTSQRGPLAEDFSHYYTQPQLAVQARLRLDGRETTHTGTAWLDHEWSEKLVPDNASGWDWIGMNLDNGAALTASQVRGGPGGPVRGGPGGPVWAGCSYREANKPGEPGEPVQTFFGPQAVRFEPLRYWKSPATGASYPVGWRVTTPIGRFDINALMDAQELDSRASTASVYWEGLADLLDAGGRRVGRGYLEMTGYVEPLRRG
jgi:predicted secreted hydrolase